MTNWQTKKLGDISEIMKGKGLAKNDIVENGKYECIHYGELFIKYNEVIKKVKSRTNIDKDVFLSKSNDVLMPTSDVTPRGLATASCLPYDGVVIGGDVLVVRPKQGTLDGKFLAYFVAGNKQAVLRLTTGSTIFHLYGSDMRKLKIDLPSKAEQERIVGVLEVWDEYIEKLEQKIALKEQLKKGLMQQLLTGKRRLPGFEAEWRKITLGELYNITSSKRVFESDWTRSGVPFYRAREVIKLRDNGHVSNELFISGKMFKEYKDKYGSVKENDILVTGVGTIGVAYRIRKFTDFYFKDGNIIWLRDQCKVSSAFVEHLFNSSIIRKQIHQLTPITTVATYTIEMAKATEIILPEMDEQSAISEVLTQSADDISKLKKLRGLVIKQKKYLLKNLITGTIRTPENLKPKGAN